MAGTKLKIEKVLGVLPPVLTPNTIYFVRTLTGFDIYITDNNSLQPTAYKNNLDDESFERINQNLRSLPKETIFDSEGNFISQVIDTGFGTSITKTISYNNNGAISSIALDMHSDNTYVIRKNFDYVNNSDGTFSVITSYTNN